MSEPVPKSGAADLSGVPTVGLVGSGPWASSVMAPQLAESPRVEFAGLFARNQRAATALAEQYRVPVIDRFDDLLAAVDVVCFSVPPDVQLPLAIQAAIAGRHLLLEKPVARDLVGAEQLAAAIRSRPIRTAVHYSRLLGPGMAELIAAQQPGVVGSGRVVIRNGALLSGSQFVDSPWRQEQDGTLWDLGPHAFSVLLLALGPAAWVQARRDGDAVLFDTMHRSGVPSQAAVSLRDPNELEAYEFTDYGGRVSALQEPVPVGRATFAALLDALVEDAHDPCLDAIRDPDFSTGIVRTLAAAERSLAAGTPVEP